MRASQGIQILHMAFPLSLHRKQEKGNRLRKSSASIQHELPAEASFRLLDNVRLCRFQDQD